MSKTSRIQDFVEEIRSEISLNDPELISLFETYAAEAIFGRNLIDSDLKLLPLRAAIFEVGAGSLILSCQLSREGYSVTALEPIAEGFSHFRKLQNIVLNTANKYSVKLRIINSPAENLDLVSMFDYAFSINVMEHVRNEKQVIENILISLKDRAKYRFICPNYIFPYEPHFNIPIVLNKNLTEKLFRNRINSYHLLSDPLGTWQSLNWISVPKIRKIISESKNLRVTFHRDLFLKMLNRAVTDNQFSKRRSKWMNAIFRSIVSLRLHQLTAYIPVTVQPVIDCEIQRRK